MSNNEVLVFTSSSGNASVVRHRMSATFGFCHNSLNSVKIIQYFQYFRQKDFLPEFSITLSKLIIARFIRKSL